MSANFGIYFLIGLLGYVAGIAGSQVGGWHGVLFVVLGGVVNIAGYGACGEESINP